MLWLKFLVLLVRSKTLVASIMNFTKREKNNSEAEEKKRAAVEVERRSVSRL